MQKGSILSFWQKGSINRDSKSQWWKSSPKGDILNWIPSCPTPTSKLANVLNPLSSHPHNKKITSFSPVLNYSLSFCNHRSINRSPGRGCRQEMAKVEDRTLKSGGRREASWSEMLDGPWRGFSEWRATRKGLPMASHLVVNFMKFSPHSLQLPDNLVVIFRSLLHTLFRKSLAYWTQFES